MQCREEPRVIQLKQDRTQNKHHQRRNQHLLLLAILEGRKWSPLLLSWGWEWICASATYEINLNSVLLWKKQFAPLSHTALPSAPALALLYSSLLEVVLTSWNITGQLQSKHKCRHNLMWTTQPRGWISHFNGTEFLDLLLLNVSFE